MNKNQNKKNQSGILSGKQFRYGSVSLTLTIVFIAAVIVLNVIFSALAGKFGLFIDLTKNQLYNVSETTNELLKDVNTEIKIKFCMPLDSLENNETYKMVLTCAQEYERRFDFVSIEYCDIISDPKTLDKYKKLGYEMRTDSVIIESMYRCKVYRISNFFVYAESTGNVYGFKGESRFTSSIIACASEALPVVSFTQGHGETVPSQLEEMFTNSGFSVERVNLATDDISDDTKILVINDPQTDFAGIFSSTQKGTSEIDKLTEYLNSRRHVMIFVDKDTPEMPELDEVLSEWGIVINHKQMVMDEEKSIRSAANTVVCQYADSFASSLHSSVSSADSPVNTIVVEAVPLTLLFGQADTDIIANGAVLKTYPSSYVTVDGEQIKGEYTVMALATKAEYVNNVATRTHVLVCGSTYFTELTYASSYGNNEIIFNAMKMMGQTANTIDIEWKRTDDKTLKLDTGIAQNLTVVLSAVIPSIVLILGICVAIHRRKYR